MVEAAFGPRDRSPLALPDLRSLKIDKEDVAFEEEILRNRFSVRSWLRYVDHKQLSDLGEFHPETVVAVSQIYERALAEFPFSYKIWYNYILYRVKESNRHKPDELGVFQGVNNLFERSIVFMNKMPRIWIEYIRFLSDQCSITRCRRTIDRALKSLPVTQHERIWPLYIDLVTSHLIPNTGVRVFRRYLKLFPERAEEYINYLRDVHSKLGSERCRELSSLRVYLDLLNDQKFMSKEGKSKHQIWTEMCELISENPLDLPSVKFEPIIRQGIRRYKEQIGILWNCLASYYIRKGFDEKARDIYEEALVSVSTIRDFSQVFDAYSLYEENFLTKMIEHAKRDNEGKLTEEQDLEMELRLTRMEYLMDRRPLLLNSVLLRQNPHNVCEWLRRVDLMQGTSPEQIVQTFNEAVQTVDPVLAIGRAEKLWIEFATFYEKANKLDEADKVFSRATEVNFKNVDDLATVWCEWAELKLRQNNTPEAIRVLERATTITSDGRRIDYFDQSQPVQKRLCKNIKVWSMYADLEESLGTFKTCKAVYEQIINLRICTPRIIMNYGCFLEENNYYEDAFRAYEKGISLFQWPVVFDIWLVYLTKFITRYKGTKLERTRDLFEQCIGSCSSPKFSKPIYLLYAKFEEEFGLPRRALRVYERAVDAVSIEEKFEIYKVYLCRTCDQNGITATRPIYEKAIEELPDDEARQLCLQYAEVERKLGEIDRARAIYSHCSQMCDPRVTPDFWQTWKEFEIKHGSEDTLRDMLRIRRSIQATYNVQVNYMTAQMMATAGQSAVTASMDPMELRAAKIAKEIVENRARSGDSSHVSFVSGGVEGGKEVEDENPERIVLRKIDDVEQKEVPLKIRRIEKNVVNK
ncbi:hypothetical protein ACOME3_002388 [Neoechinorhynchus agilis]